MFRVHLLLLQSFVPELLPLFAPAFVLRLLYSRGGEARKGRPLESGCSISTQSFVWWAWLTRRNGLDRRLKLCVAFQVAYISYHSTALLLSLADDRP
jgi:hypothetical protein